MAGFQTQVNSQPAPGLPGTLASANPVATVDAGEAAFVAATGGVIVGNFAWVDGTTNLGGGTAQNSYIVASGPLAPDGLVMNQGEALITTWLGQATLVVPQGLPVTLAQRGDFWGVSNAASATRGQKVFANLFNGAVLVDDAGAFPVDNIGTNAVVTASFATSVMTVSAVTSGVLAVGQLVQGAGIPANTYILSLGTGTGGTGTYNLTQTVGTIAGETVTATSPDGVGGASTTAVTTSSSTSLDITAVSYGVVQVGMLVKGTGIPAGAYIAGLGTSTGGIGTVTLSAAATASATVTVTASPWIETPWYALSDGNPGDLIKIGVKN